MVDSHTTDPPEEVEELLVFRVTQPRVGVDLQRVVVTERHMGCWLSKGIIG